MSLTQSIAKDFLTVLRRMLPRRSCSQQVVELLQVDGATALRVSLDGHVLAWGNVDAPSMECIRFPVQLLKDCAAAKQNPISVSVQSDTSILSEWTDHDIPQTRRYEGVAAEEPMAVPMRAVKFCEQSPELLDALSEAALTCDSESSRYALGCIQMRGRRGDLVATDGRQMLIQGGFDLGFDEEILVPASKVFACPLWKKQSVSSGLTDEHYVLRVGAWTLWLPLQKKGRFPEVDQCIPNRSFAISEVDLNARDLAFLANNLDRLPGKEDPFSPVTVELNGSTVVRARGKSSANSTELVLCNSRRQGRDLRFQTNRQYLKRAAHLGLRSLYAFGDRQPVLCTGAGRSFVWALLDPSDGLSREAHDVRIYSSPTKAAAMSR